MVIHHEIEIFYDTQVVCGCSKCQGLKEKPQLVTLIHYTNDMLPNVDGLIPPTTVKNPIDDIGNTHKNASLCSFLKMLEAKTTMSHHTLTNPSDYVHSIEILCDPKYDLNFMQPISTRRSKNLHELREKISKYTPMSIHLL